MGFLTRGSNPGPSWSCTWQLGPWCSLASALCCCAPWHPCGNKASATQSRPPVCPSTVVDGIPIVALCALPFAAHLYLPLVAILKEDSCSRYSLLWNVTKSEIHVSFINPVDHEFSCRYIHFSYLVSVVPTLVWTSIPPQLIMWRVSSLKSSRHSP